MKRGDNVVKIKCYLVKKYKSMLMKSAVYATILSLLLSSVIVVKVGEQYQQNINDQFNIFVAVSSPLNMQLLSKQMYTESFIKDDELYKKNLDEFINFDRQISDDLYEYHDLSIYYQNVSNIGLKNGKPVSLFVYGSSVDNRRIKSIWNDLGDSVVYISGLKKVSLKEKAFLDMRLGNVSIVDGRSFTDEELKNGDDVCIIPDNYGLIVNDNGKISFDILNIGDSFLITDFIHKSTGAPLPHFYLISRQYKVVGKFSSNESANNDISKNVIYIPESTFIKEMNENYQSLENDDDLLMSVYGRQPYYVSSYVYQVKNLKKLNKLIQTVENNMTSDMTYYANTETTAGLLSSVSSVTDSVKEMSLVICFLGGLLGVMVIILDLFMNKKSQSMRLSLGESRKSVYLYTLLENILSLLMALLFAMVIVYLECGVIVANQEKLFNKSSRIVIETIKSSGTINGLLETLSDVRVWGLVLFIMLFITIAVAITIRSASPRELLEKQE